jgi:hypothetical protein
MKEKTVDRVAIGLGGVLLALVALEATVIPHYHPEFPWHYVPGYSAMIGLFGCLVVVMISKWLGKAFLQRPEETE